MARSFYATLDKKTNKYINVVTCILKDITIMDYSVNDMVKEELQYIPIRSINHDQKKIEKDFERIKGRINRLVNKKYEIEIDDYEIFIFNLILRFKKLFIDLSKIIRYVENLEFNKYQHEFRNDIKFQLNRINNSISEYKKKQHYMSYEDEPKIIHNHDDYVFNEFDPHSMYENIFINISCPKKKF